MLDASIIEINWRPLLPEQANKNNTSSFEVMMASASNSSDHDPENLNSELLKSVVVDLTKPLKEQLEQIKLHVIIAQRRLKEQGRLFPYTIAGKKTFGYSVSGYWMPSKIIVLSHRSRPIFNRNALIVVLALSIIQRFIM